MADWLDTVGGWISDAGEAVDEWLGYSSAAGSADEWELFDTADFDSLGVSGISGPVSSFIDVVGDTYKTIQPYASKALTTYNALTGEKEDRGLFGAPKYDKVKADASTFGVGTFSAGKGGSVAGFGLGDARVADAWSRVRSSQNPAIRSSLDYVRPTITAKGPTITLKSSSKVS